MLHLPLALLLAAVALGPAMAAGGDSTPADAPRRPAPVKTGKERLSDKGSDEQRVDDCKVPPERRTRDRVVSCPWDVGS